MVDQRLIRNFAIVAHIDHGKSTLADRMLEITGVKKLGEGQQVLDSNPIEQERGITIKLAPVRMEYRVGLPHQVEISHNFKSVRDDKADLGSISALSNTESGVTDELYVLNLIDTPGHVDFSYEVSRALAACEGVVLLVDATQGIQAQTLAHYYQAKKLGLVMIPVINKIDLASAEVEGTERQLVEDLGFSKEEVLRVSAKTGEGVERVLRAIAERVTAPGGDVDKPLRALIFNSHYDAHLGVVAWVRVVDGKISIGEELKAMGTGVKFEVEEVGYFEGISNHSTRLRAGIKEQISNTQMKYQKDEKSLFAGEVGWVVTGTKDAHEIQVGDTVTVQSVKNLLRRTLSSDASSDKCKVQSGKTENRIQNIKAAEIGTQVEPLPGYKSPKPMVWVAFYPVDADEYQQLKEALEKLRLMDSALTFSPEFSPMLGRGFRVGFLGLLHAEVVQERLEREFDLSVFASAASVSYRVRQTGKEPVVIKSPAELPEGKLVIEEPMLDLTVYTPDRYLGTVMQLLQDCRGKTKEMGYVGSQVRLDYEMPLSELVGGFYDRLKSKSSGFASVDYQLAGWQEGDLVRLDVLLAGEKVDALSQIVPREKVDKVGRDLVEKLAEVISRQQFEIAIQAAIGGKIIARSTVKAFRKDVTQKLYGGDQTRKDKLLKKQKKGKKRMKQLGKVQVEPDVFFRLMR